MREYILSILEESGTLTSEQILLNLAVAVLLGGAIYLSYWFTHSGTMYSKKFNVSLATLTLLTAGVMTVIGNNIALSLGMVGALSIVRFRTAIKDSRDAIYIFWAIVVGISCGVGDYFVAGAVSALAFLVLLLLGRVRNENRILLIIRGDINLLAEIEGVVFRYFNAKAMLKVKNTTPDNVELVYEMSRKTYELARKQDVDIARALYKLGNIEYVNTVTQSDEITG